MAGRSGTTAQLVTQHDVDAWYGSGASTRGHANNFLYWAIDQRLVGKIAVPWQPHGNDPLASKEDYIEALRALLLHETPRYLFRGPATGPPASGPGMTVSPCRTDGLGGG
ncbi:hypothetical protein ACFVZR_37795, partial [Streptomyces sp. NPDC058316]|uniref:hypothetical protein n=1 Tax=unclassified Streptomyces TaxID=2593676 RepID=UPI00331C7028